MQTEGRNKAMPSRNNAVPPTDLTQSAGRLGFPPPAPPTPGRRRGGRNPIRSGRLGNLNRQTALFRLRSAAAWGILLLGIPLQAHDPGLSTTQLTVGTAGLTVTIGYSPADLRPLLGAKAKNASDWNAADFSAMEPQLRLLAPQFWKIASKGALLAPHAVREELTASNTVSFELHFSLPATGLVTIESGVMDRLPPGHRDFLSAANEKGAVLLERLVDADSGKIPVRN